MTCARCSWTSDRELTDDDGQRVPARTQLEWHAADKAHPLCSCCGTSLTEHEPAVCEADITAARTDLALIVAMHAELPEHLGQASGQSFGRRGGDEHALPGGTIMAMLGPGSAGGRARRLTPSDRARNVEGREHRVDQLPGDPPSVAWSLLSWAMDWSETRDDGAYHDGEAPWASPATVPAFAGYLEVHCRWAANSHPAFAYFAAELRSLRLALEDVTGRTRKPTKAGADCFRCSNPMQLLVDPDTGLEDEHATCGACRTKYGPAEYASAVKVAAWSAAWITRDGERWATPAVLAGHLGRSEHTVRSWAQRGNVRARVEARLLFVHVEDTEARHADRMGRSA